LNISRGSACAADAEAPNRFCQNRPMTWLSLFQFFAKAESGAANSFVGKEAKGSAEQSIVTYVTEARPAG